MNGTQTSGNIFDIKDDDTNEIQNIIREEVENIEKNSNRKRVDKKMPTDYSLYGWFISLKVEVFRPHIHTEGCQVGYIYKRTSETRGDGNNLVVSLGEENDAVIHV